MTKFTSFVREKTYLRKDLCSSAIWRRKMASEWLILHNDRSDFFYAKGSSIRLSWTPRILFARWDCCMDNNFQEEHLMWETCPTRMRFGKGPSWKRPFVGKTQDHSKLTGIARKMGTTPSSKTIDNIVNALCHNGKVFIKLSTTVSKGRNPPKNTDFGFAENLGKCLGVLQAGTRAHLTGKKKSFFFQLSYCNSVRALT